MNTTKTKKPKHESRAEIRWESRAIIEATIREAHVAADLFCCFMRANGLTCETECGTAEPTPVGQEFALGIGFALRLNQLEELLGPATLQERGLPTSLEVFLRALKALRGNVAQDSIQQVGIALLGIIQNNLSWVPIRNVGADIVVPEPVCHELISAVAQLLWSNRHLARQGADV